MFALQIGVNRSRITKSCDTCAVEEEFKSPIVFKYTYFRPLNQEVNVFSCVVQRDVSEGRSMEESTALT